MTIRMQDLAARSGLPKTTIHHYAREGLLPPASKPAPNAALYGEEHLERLRLVSSLRGEEGDGLSIPEIRRVLAYLEAGLDRATAIRLVADAVDPPIDAWRDIADDTAAFAAAAGIGEKLAAELTRVGIVGRESAEYAPADLVVARGCDELCTDVGVQAADLGPLADLMGEIGAYSGSLLELYAAQAAADGASADDARARLAGALRRLLDGLLWRELET